MIWHERPRKAGRLGFKKKKTQAVKERFIVQIVLEDSLSFDPPDHQMVEASREAYPRLPRHDPTLSNPEQPVNLYMGCPYFPYVTPPGCVKEAHWIFSRNTSPTALPARRPWIRCIYVVFVAV